LRKKEEISSSFNFLSSEDKIDLLSELILSLNEIRIPIKIFDNDKLSIFEAVVKFLKENLKFRYVKIASLLNRSDKTIWATYNKSRQKMPEPFTSVDSKILIPISKLSDRKYTIFESVVLFLKNSGFSNHEIARMLQRDDRTIWATYNRKNG